MHNLVGDKLKAVLKDAERSIAELGVRTGTHPGYWSQVINGTKRLSVDLAIRLGKVFPDKNVRSSQESINGWIELQASSDKANAQELNGAMYRNIKPFKEE